MTDQFSSEQLNEIMFLNLVLMFQTSAMQHMGKLKNPISDNSAIIISAKWASAMVMMALR